MYTHVLMSECNNDKVLSTYVYMYMYVCMYACVYIYI